MKYFDYQSAMEYIGIKSPITLRKYISNGLPTIKVGKSKRISRSDIDEFMAAHRVVANKDK